MELKKNDLSGDFKIDMPSTQEDSQNDLEYENHLIKDIEASCNFSVYVDKLDIKDEFTDEELISQKTKEEIVKYKNEQIDKLKAYISSLEQEKEDLIDNFKDTTSLLLDKIKDFESDPYYQKKKTNEENTNENKIIDNNKKTKNKDNNIDNNIDNNNNNDNKNDIKDYYSGLPKDFNKIERPQTAVIAEQLKNPKINSTKMQRCANCQKEVLESEFVAHSLICLRHTFRCKKCGELINEKEKKNIWKNIEIPKKSIML